ncbi:hypothetical protein EDC04DRAFT_1862733 [Pisolithus marmoratus]|nr:hypothetical protein EDC04DRAFT_1862733 [Pisolithus marmoratus]
MSQIQRGSKRARSPPIPGSSPAPRPSPRRRESASSLPPSSPPAPFSDTDDNMEESEVVKDLGDEEDEDGEDLFGAEMQDDYAPNELLDHYSDQAIDDEGEYEAMSAAARRACRSTRWTVEIG